MRRRNADIARSGAPGGRMAVAVLAAAMLLVAGVRPDPAAAQASEGPRTGAAEWRLFVDREPAAWPLAEMPAADSLERVAGEVVDLLRHQGYYFARLDSVTIDTSAASPVVQLYTTRGAEVLVGEIVLRGNRVLSDAALRASMETRPGLRLDRERLEADLGALLDRYETEGRPLAQIRVAEVALLDGDPRLRLVLEVEEGRAVVLDRVQVVGAERTRAALVARLAGVRTGRPLAGYAPEAIRDRLQQAGLFRDVGLPELVVTPDSGAVLRIPIEDEPPGTFDLVLGYLPPAGAGAAGHLVGNGRLALRNLFGQGRALSLRLDRLPGQVSSVDAEISDPFLFGLPLEAAGGFSGLQQDSTYGKQTYRGEAGYRFAANAQLVGTFSREVTRPGQAGLRLVRGRQRIPRAEASFVGLGVRVVRVDRRENPARGLVAEIAAERGRKARSYRRAAQGDTTSVRSTLAQERMRGSVRVFVPTWPRQLVVVGADAAALVSDVYDRSDLLRFGGATTLRGYDEERFLGRRVGRVLVEYRYRLDRLSYAYLFTDLGWVDTPSVEEEGIAAGRGLYPGYGLGIQFSTQLGLVNVSAALNPEDGPAGARIHAGLSFGL